MKRLISAGIVVLVAALVPMTSVATATDGSWITPAPGEIESVQIEMDGSGEINVYGVVRCSAAGPLNLDVILEQPSTGGVGGGGSNSHVCLKPGDLVKWVIDATGGPWMVDHLVKVTSVAVGAANDTTVRTHTLRWGIA